MIKPEKRFVEKFILDHPSALFANYRKFNCKVKAKSRRSAVVTTGDETSILNLSVGNAFMISSHEQSVNSIGRFWQHVFQITGHRMSIYQENLLRKIACDNLSDLILEYFSLIHDWNHNDDPFAYARSIDKKYEILMYIENLYRNVNPQFSLGLRDEKT